MRKTALLRSASLGLAPRLVALSVLVAGLAGGSVAASVISSARTALRDEILQTHLTMADLVGSRVAEYVEDVERDATELASRAQVRQALEANDFEALDATLAEWQATRQDRMDGLSVYSTDGTMRATARANRSLVGTLASGGNTGAIQEVARTGQLALGEALRSKTSGNPIVPIYVPVHSDAGEVEGVVSATLSLSSLTNTLLGLELAPNSRVTLMDNVHGLTLVTDDTSRILSATTTGRNAAAQLARAGERGAIENTRSDGESTLAAFSPVSSLNWSVLLQESSETAFAPIDSMTRGALAWVGLAVLFAAAIAATLAISVVRPLRTLRATAERMAGGDLARRTGVRSADEIGDLGHALDRMAEQLQSSVQELTRQALSDTLTALPNRMLMRQRLDHAMQSGERLSLLVMDLDRFKEVNDTLGHPVGDELLQQLGERLAAAVRRSDTVARLGGDEFAVILEGANQSQAVAIAETLRTVVGKPFDLAGRLVSVGTSIGVACLPDHAVDSDTLLRCADVAMYVAKRSGQGVAVYNSEQDEHTPERLNLISELRGAIDKGALTLVFQPLIDCEQRHVRGVEALVRWPHPRYGLLPPDQFIPIAEQTGLIRGLSRWVLESALKQHNVWRSQGVDLPVSVNLSMRDLHDPALPETVACLLNQAHVPADSLRIEITESSLMLDPSRAFDTVRRLREIGVGVSIDDFGTGYSSLGYLKQLPVDELKIDRSFIRHMADDTSDLAIVRSTIELAHNLGLSVVAEGVEDERSEALLQEIGCDTAQGYLFSRPLPAIEFTNWLVEHDQSRDRLNRAA